MERAKDLKELYHTELLPRLQPVEDLRKKVLKRYLIALVVVVIPVLILLVVVGSNNHSERMSGDVLVTVQTISTLIGLVFSGLIVAVILVVMNQSLVRKYRMVFKQYVVAELVNWINPEWEYFSDHMIPERIYKASRLSPRSYDEYSGDDLVKGKIGQTDFECCELHTIYKSSSTDSSGNRSESTSTVFQGLFFHADFNKEFKGYTCVLPDTLEKVFGKLGQRLQSLSSKGLVKLENPEFERAFAVYSSDQIEARYILTPAIMEAMLRIKNKIGASLAFAFEGDRVYCSAHFGRDLFEAKILTSSLNLVEVEEMYELLMFNKLVVEELNLNTRIWTKE